VKSIEEYKKEILLMVMSKRFSLAYLLYMPKDDELRTFIGSLNPEFSYYYALLVDECPHEETRKGAYRSPNWEAMYKEEFGE
jgi:hypothetical protein